MSLIKKRDLVTWCSDQGRQHYGKVADVFDGDRCTVRYPDDKRERVIRCSRLMIVAKIPAPAYRSFPIPAVPTNAT